MSGFEEVPQPLIQRDRFERPMIINPETGEMTPYRRVTTFVGVLDDQFNINRWASRKAIEGVVGRRDLTLAVSSLGTEPAKMIRNPMNRWTKNPDHKRWVDAMNDLVSQGQAAAASKAAATSGTAFHRFYERADRGEDLGTVPLEIAPHIANYHVATEDMTMMAIERFAVLDDLAVGGTPDRVIRLAGRDTPMIMDIKTGTMEFGVLKMAMQLACYAHARFYDPETAERTDLGVDQDTAIIVHSDQVTGECVALEIDIATGWEAVQVAREVWAMRAKRSLTKPLHRSVSAPTVAGPRLVDTMPPVDMSMMWRGKATLSVEGDLALVKALRHATTEEQLLDLWRQVQPTAWGEHHTYAAQQRKRELAMATAFGMGSNDQDQKGD